MPNRSRHPFLVHLDGLIDRHQHTADKELLESLRLLRDELDRSISEGRKRDAVRIFLQIASWVKFFFDIGGE